MAGDPHLTFDGSGDYVSTPDVNLLDADEANMQQGIGGWVQWAGGVVDHVDAPGTPPWAGTKAVHQAVDAADAHNGFRGPKNPVALDNGEDYTYSIWLYSTKALNAQPTKPYARILATGDGVDDAVYLPAVPANTWTFCETSFVSTGNAIDTVQMYVQVYYTGEAIGEDFDLYICAASIRRGTDGTFLPSMDIQGTKTETMDSTPAGAPAAWTKDAALEIGESWAGEVRSYEMRDGGASGPIVIRLAPADVYP